MPHVDIAITSHGHLNDLQRFERLQVDRLAGQDLVQDIRRYPPQVQVVVVENLETGQSDILFYDGKMLT